MFGDVVQSGSGTGSSGVASATLSSGATTGNLLIFSISRAATHGIGGSWGTPSGWTNLPNSGVNNGNMGCGAWYKIAEGGETSVSSNGTNEQGNWCASIVEYEGPFASSPLDKTAENEANLASTTTSISSGTTDATTQSDALAVAYFGVDIGLSVGTRTLSNDFSEAVYVSSSARAPNLQARRVLSTTGTYSTTFGWGSGGSADEAYGAIAIFKKEVTEEPPTIELNTADEAVLSTRPTLEFTAYDVEDDDVRYQIQISDSPDFLNGEILADSCEGSGSALHPNPLTFTAWTGEWQVDDRFGQSFMSNGGKLSKIAMQFGSDTSATDGDVVVRLYEHQGTFGSTGEPLNAAEPNDTPTPGWLSESNSYYCDTSCTGETWREFDFEEDQKIHFEAGQPYFLIQDWHPNSNNSLNTVAFVGDPSKPHEGNAYIDGQGSFNNGPSTVFDVNFRLYVVYRGLDKVSGTDDGFVNTEDGGDTDPFTAGQKVSFTVQAADELEVGVKYYWRVRAIDPGGSGIYSDWSEIRSFTTEETTPGGVSIPVIMFNRVQQGMS